MRIVVITTTLDTVELFMQVQLTTVPSRLLITLNFSIVMVDTKGSAIRGESLENVMCAVFNAIGKTTTGLMAVEEIVLV